MAQPMMSLIRSYEKEAIDSIRAVEYKNLIVA